MKNGYGPPALDGEVLRAGEAKEPMAEGEKDALIKQIRENIDDAWEHDKENRTEASTDLAFLSGDQWPDTVRRQREAADRPVLTINRLPQFVRQITNDIRQADIAIQAAPEDGDSDPKLAEVYDGLLRLIQYQSSAKHVFSTAAEHQAGCGIGWFRVDTRYVDDEAFDQEIVLRAIQNPLSVFCDPGAVLPDRSDAHWIAVTESIPKKSFERRFPGKSQTSLEAPIDLPEHGVSWMTSDDVLVAEYWVKEPYKKTIALLQTGETVDADKLASIPGAAMMVAKLREVTCHKIMQYLVSGADILEGPHEWPGKYIPIIPVVGGEFPLERKTYRYSAIRFARDPQQLYNFYRTSNAEVIALQPKAPWLVTTKMIGAFKALWDRAHKANLPYLPYEIDPAAPTAAPKREAPPAMSPAMANEAMIAAEDMKATTGIYDAALGAKSNETSGVAIGRRQLEADVANYHFADNLQRSLEHAGRVLIDLIPKVYDNERVVRLIGQGDQEQFVPINKVVHGPDGLPVVINDLSTAKYDVRVTMGRSYATKRIEAAESMTEFMRAVPQAAPVIMDLFAKAMDWPEADEIAKRLKAMVPPQALIDPDNPPPAPPPDPMQQMQMAGVEAEVRKANAEADKAEAEVQKTVVETRKAAQPEQPEDNRADNALKAIEIRMKEIELAKAERLAMLDIEIKEAQLANTKRAGEQRAQSRPD